MKNFAIRLILLVLCLAPSAWVNAGNADSTPANRVVPGVVADGGPIPMCGSKQCPPSFVEHS